MKKSFLLCLLMAFFASWVTVQADPLFSENFEGGSMPTGWTTEGQGSWTVGTGVNSSYPSKAGEGTYNAAIKHGTTSNATKLITPAIDLSAATSAELSFMHVQIDWTGDVDELRVYYRASSTDEWVLLSGQVYTSAVSSWTTEDGIALPNLSATYQIAFEMTDNWGRGVGIDDVKIVQGASCAKPTGLDASTIAPTEATIDWVGPDDYEGFQLEYSLTGAFAGEQILIDEDELDKETADLEDLTPASTYYVRVRAFCGGEDYSDWSSTFSFKTKCVAVTEFPWSEHFDSLTITSVMPDCWSSINKNTSSYYLSYPYVASSSEAYSASKFLYFYTYGNKEYAILPEMNDLDGKRIVFRAKSNNAGVKLRIGRMTDPEDENSFVQIGTDIALTTAYQKYAVNMAEEGNHIAIMLVPSTSYSYDGAYIDNIVVEEIPACLEVSGLSFVSSTTNSAVLNWTASESGETEWDIYYSTENVAPTAETEPSIVDATAKEIPSGLNASTIYYVWVRAHCSETAHGEWSEGISFETKCEAIVITEETPWMEGFEDYEGTTYSASGIIPVCWNNHSTGSVKPHVIGSGSYYYTHGGSKALTFYGSGYCYAILPEIANELNTLQISFWMQVENASNGTLTLGYITEGDNNMSTFTVIGDAFENQASSMALREMELSSVPAEATRLVFRWYYSGQYSCCIDDVKLSLIPSCKKVASIAEPTNITANSATFSWEAGNGETDFQYVVVPAGEEPSWASPVDVIGANTVTVETGLAANTAYDFYVRANCGEKQSEALSISFRTGCAPYAAATWADDFEDGIYCWRMGNRQSALSNYKPYLYSGAAHDGEYGLYLRAYNANTVPADSSYAVLPEMNYGEKSLKDFTLSFYARSTYNNVDAYNQHLLIGVVEDPADSLATFVQVADVEVTDKYDLYEVSLANYTGAGQHIVLLATVPANYTGDFATLYGHFYVDDIALVETPACQALRKITISDVARRSMVVNLIPKINVALGEYQLVCSTTKLDEAALEAAEKINVSAASYEINGLDRETKYYIYVRANCGSTWVCDSATTKGLHYTDYAIVADGTTENSYAPVHGINADSKQRVQSIYPAALLTDLQGKTISKLAYSIKSESSKDSWRKGSESFNVRMGITTSENLSSAWASEALTLVYNGVLDASGTTMEIDLATPFAYTDGNLVIEFELPNATTWESASFLGIEQASGSRYAEGSSYATAAGSVQNFLPRVEFSYEVALPACPAVTELTASVLGTGTTQEKISWAISDADYLSGFDMIVSESELDAEALATAEITFQNIQGNSKDLEGLTPATHYYVYLRAICQAESHDEGTSDWSVVEFTTLANCPAVINLALSLGATDSITAVWDRATLEQEKTFRYILSTSRMDEDALAAAVPTLVEDTVIAFAGLAHETKYYFYVASACGEQTSAYVEDSIETLPVCQAVENLTVVRTKHNLVELSWASAQFASEAQWEVGIVDDNNVHTQVVNERKAVIFGLTAETAYTAYVKAICGEESVSAEATINFATEAQPGDCKQVGDGTTQTSYGPIYTYFQNTAYTQQLYKASEISASAGTITSIAFEHKGNSSNSDLTASDYKIYMAETTEESLPTSWISDGLTEVFAGSTTFEHGEKGNWVTINLTTPFTWDGTKNIVVAIYTPNVPTLSAGSYDSYFYGASASGCALYKANPTVGENLVPSASGSTATRPNIQFCFEAKACPDVANMAVSDITTSSAKVSWDPMGSEMAWNIILSDHAVTDFTDVEAERVETVSKAFAGLNDDTDYFVYVQPANDCPTAEYSMVSFRTVASCLAPINAAVVSETITKHSARVTWVDPNETPAGSYTVAYAKVNDFDLTDPMIATVQVTDTFADLVALQADTIYKFAVMANCGSEDPSRYSAVAQFTTPIACFKPTNPGVVAESITANSAVLYWTDEHDQAGYIIAYGPYNTFDITDPTTYEIALATDTFKLLENLEEATQYRFRVKSDCGEEGQSKDWSSYASFTTTCAAKTVPFSEDFENADRFNYCWTKGNRETTSTSYIPSRSSTAKLTGENGLYMKAEKSEAYYSWYDDTDADSAYAVLPELNFGEEGIAAFQMTFQAKSYTSSYSSYYQHILIGVADDEELTNLEIVKDQELTGEFDEYEVSFAAQSGNKRIVLLAIVDPTSTASSRYAEIYVDDIFVSHVANCKRPATVAAEVKSATSATITWTAGGSEENFQVACVLSGEEPNWDAAELVAGLSFTIDTLSIDNDYDFYVRAYCGETEQSDFRMTSAHVGYCIPAPTSVDKQGIIAIAFNEGDAYTDIHPTSSPYYADNKDIEFIAHPDEKDSIQITYKTYYSYGTVIWIDWNNNLAFEATEVVFAGTSEQSGTSSSPEETTLNCVFQIPAETELGFYRMRIGGADNFFDNYISNPTSNVADPCNSGTYCLYEDYTIKVVEKPIDPTGLSGAGIDGVVIKRIENDQVVIIRNGEKFTIMGVKIQ